MVIIANEQNIIEWNNMILTCVANNIFSKKYNGLTVNEDEITRGICDGDKDKMLMESARFIEDNSKIIFFIG
jgi:hypothetical protein